MSGQKNILEQIEESFNLPKIGHGQEATVYPLAGMENEYVIRVRDDSGYYTDELNLSSSLTPVNYGLNDRLVAPPLMQVEGISIHPRQPGQSLAVMWKQKSDMYVEKGKSRSDADTQSYIDVLKMLVGLPNAEYERLLQDMNYLTIRKRSIEPQGDNLMLSDHSIRWVDLAHQPQNNHLGNVKHMLFTFNLDTKGLSDSEEINELKSELEEKLNNAAENTLTPLTEQDVQLVDKHPYLMKKPIVDPNAGIQAIPLSSAPKALEQMLKKVEQHNSREY